MTTAPTGGTVTARAETRWYLGFLALTVVLWMVSFPYSLAALVTGPIAAYFAVRSLYLTRREPLQLGFRVGLAIGLVIIGMTMLEQFVLLVLFEPYWALKVCTDNALTHQALAQCNVDFNATLTELTERLSR